jgi:hypothetical protein
LRRFTIFGIAMTASLVAISTATLPALAADAPRPPDPCDKELSVSDAEETDFYARKGNLQCLVQLHRMNGGGEKLVIPATDDAIAAKLGGLCVKLFAAHSGD